MDTQIYKDKLDKLAVEYDQVLSTMTYFQEQYKQLNNHKVELEGAMKVLNELMLESSPDKLELDSDVDDTQS